MPTDLYAFAFRGLLAEESVQRTGHLRRHENGDGLDSHVAARLPLDLLDDELVARARRMATVYIAIAAFENSVRDFVAKRLLEEIGADWWEKCVSEKIRTKAESRRKEEVMVRWHTPRGEEPITFTEFGDLSAIVSQNWPQFENHVVSQDWMKHIISTLERSRNVIMHSGELGMQDVERVGTVIRDWVRQLGG